MKNNAIITLHLSTGDVFTSMAIVLHYQSLYKNVYIFSLKRNEKLTKQLYEKYDNIHITVLNDDYNCHAVPNESVIKLSNELGNNANIIPVGSDKVNWNHFQDVFYRRFYRQIHLDYELRYKYCKINRCQERENSLFEMFTKKYGKNYIFVHDHRHFSYVHYDNRYKDKFINIKSDLVIFHPNINYYGDIDNDNEYYNCWDQNLYSDNILDYCKIIENATEIHIMDSAFSCLCPYLDLENVKTKKVYTTGIDFVDYHKSYKNWDMISGFY